MSNDPANLNPPPEKKGWSLRGWLINFAIWTFLAFFIATQQITARPYLGSKDIPWADAIMQSLVWAYLWAIATRPVFKMVNLFPFDRTTWIKALIVHVCLATICVFVFVFFGTNLDFIIRSLDETVDHGEKKWASWTETMKMLFAVNTHTYLLTYSCIVAVAQTLDFYKKYRAKELAANQLETELVLAQLNQLRAQLHPHFLFNTLSAITTLIYENRETAEQMVVRLSELLRMALEQPNSQLRSLEEELLFIQKYLEIEALRFGERLQFRQDIAPESPQAMVPFLILQPLIENALKHGVEQSRSQCEVVLQTSIENETLVISVRDSGPGAIEIDSDSQYFQRGIGLSNTRTRLERLYPDQHHFDVRSLNPGFEIQIKLPLTFTETDLEKSE